MVDKTREMLQRHIAAQENSIARQDIRIESLRRKGEPLDEALKLLAIMQGNLKTLRENLARLSN